MNNTLPVHPLVRKLWEHWDRPTEWDTDKGILLKLAYDLADALERQQTVVEALRQIKAHEGKVCPQYETCQHESCASSYAAWVIADMALAALDAPPEGDG